MTADDGRQARLASEVAGLLRRHSPPMFAFFGHVFSYALKRDFRAVRLSKAGPAPTTTAPLVVYSNHPSWWDAAVYVWLGASLFKGRRLFAPMEKAMVARYRFMARIGAFGIDRGTREGSALFLAASQRILRDPANLLLVTAQGRFADSRERPLHLAPGIAHLAALVPQATFVPLAMDYAFWDERRPEVFLRFGAEIPTASLVGLSRSETHARLTSALEATMDGLVAEVVARDARAFDMMLSGRVGLNGVYDLWRRVHAIAAGRAFQPMHGDGR